jgi:hypothetical protein
MKLGWVWAISAVALFLVATYILWLSLYRVMIGYEQELSYTIATFALPFLLYLLSWQVWKKTKTTPEEQE